jgi:hypothetical protein
VFNLPAICQGKNKLIDAWEMEVDGGSKVFRLRSIYQRLESQKGGSNKRNNYVAEFVLNQRTTLYVIFFLKLMLDSVLRIIIILDERSHERSSNRN